MDHGRTGTAWITNQYLVSLRAESQAFIPRRDGYIGLATMVVLVLGCLTRLATCQLPWFLSSKPCSAKHTLQLIV
jgi:hypothetical protein